MKIFVAVPAPSPSPSPSPFPSPSPPQLSLLRITVAAAAAALVVTAGSSRPSRIGARGAPSDSPLYGDVGDELKFSTTLPKPFWRASLTTSRPTTRSMRHSPTPL